MYVTRAVCGLVVPMPNVDTGSLPTCKCAFQVTFLTSNGTAAPSMSPADWSKAMKAMRDWKVTFHGRIDGQKQPVPQAFQDAFKDGELEL